ncbi:HD domain-containing protein [Cohnella terricola]|uniref:HD domain-containing protein n=1 Tax=Cohnella terricola TaxID=1289167 RepID=A0A559J7G0_9BACL|nr:HD domain-containing protein [Cohnella terricola]TVX95776.1 HD domain-containing protein [Cohnella terricola]
MLTKLHEEKVFKDPVHHSIYVQDLTIWKLINTPEFQRLRRIRQLGTSYLTFHGAEHSRFSHSLGVYEITRKIISQFERNGYADWPQEEKLLSLCASLLHDVGHGPFSHSVEQIFGTNHEEWTCEVVLGDTEVNRVLREVDPRFPEQVASVIDKTYKKPIVVSLVSSQLDADRMDYLLRDAYFTGVNYGTFDLDRILRVLRPYQGKIAVKESGMHAVEDYLMSRYQMYWQVYFHPVTRSSEIVLRQIFQRARELYDTGYEFAFMLEPIRELLAGSITLGSYMKLDEAMVQTAFGQWAEERDELLSDLCGRFMRRQLYKYVPLTSEDRDWLETVRDEWMRIGLDPAYHMEVDTPVDSPYDVYKTGALPDGRDKPPILILDEREQLTEISMKSDIIRSIAGLQRGKYYMYYPADRVFPYAGQLSPETRKKLSI